MATLWKSGLGLVAALGVVILIPVLMRSDGGEGEKNGMATKTLVIVTPHNEATRYEFTHRFAQWYAAKSGGEVVRIDWRTPGGASEIARYLASEYLGAFRYEWEGRRKQPWNMEVQGAFDNPRVEPGEGSEAARARKAFLESKVSCGVDLLFGGGSYEFTQQANAGRVVDSGVVQAHPKLFDRFGAGPGAIPQRFGGEPYWDAEGRWVGVVLTAFGICYNTDALKRLGIENPPRQWADLADPRLIGSVALSDPTQSGSVAKAFEMLMQQQIGLAGGDVPEGWARGVRLIRRIAANARYFTDSATKVPWDVESGDAAAGMVIDFYGRYQSESVRRPDGSSRLQYVTPEGGSSFGADPVALMRGAPSAELAREFIEFCVTEEGQKLWNWKVGAPGGPVKYALRRLPILPELYEPRFDAFRSDPGVNPYLETRFVYHPEWTGSFFRVISFVVQTMAIEPHEELREAWRELVRAEFPPEATAKFDEVGSVDYAAAKEVLRPALSSAQKIEQVRLAKVLCDKFRQQYIEAAALARAGK